MFFEFVSECFFLNVFEFSECYWIFLNVFEIF